MYEVLTKKKFTLLLCSALLLSSSHVNAAGKALPPLETYRSKYIFVPGLPGTFDKWGNSASLEEIWDQSPDLQFQYFAFIGGVVKVGTSVAKAGITVGRTAGTLISNGVRAAGGITGMVVKSLPMALSATKDLTIQQMSAANERAAASAENKAVLARLLTQNEADKELAKQQSDAALELEKLKQETAQKEAEEETKRVQLQAETAKKQAEEETKRALAQASAAKDAAGNKAGAPQVKTVAEAKDKLKEAAKKNVVASKDLQQKVAELVTATEKVPEIAKQELSKLGAPTAFLSPKIGVGSNFTSAMESTDKTKKITAKQFQKECIKEGKTEELIGSIAERIQKESLTFEKAMDDLLKAMSTGLALKDMGPQIKAVDASWGRLMKLYSKNEETAKNYNELIDVTDSYDYDSDEFLDELLGDNDDQLDLLSEEELDAIFSDVEELKELEAELEALEKEIDEMDVDAA